MLINGRAESYGVNTGAAGPLDRSWSAGGQPEKCRKNQQSLAHEMLPCSVAHYAMLWTFLEKSLTGRPTNRC
jgi:hypothetical protein